MIRCTAGFPAAFVTAAVMLMSFCMHPVPVLAHAIVIDSYPADGATLSQPPAQVMLRFNAKIIHSLAVLDLVSDEGKRFTLPAPRDKHATATFPDRLVIPLPRLKQGSYTLRYKVLATDGHATLGILHFRIR